MCSPGWSRILNTATKIIGHRSAFTCMPHGSWKANIIWKPTASECTHHCCALLIKWNRNWIIVFSDRFLDYLGTLSDVYIVGASRVVEFAKNPKAGRPFDKCQPIRKSNCVPKMCQLKKQSNGETRYMTICAASGPSPCPRVYPWLGNTFGKLIN